MKGWQICGTETLDMHVVEEENSPLHGTVPVPRVLQNQLDHLLECYIYQTERHLLDRLEKTIKEKERAEWVATYLTMVVILHVFERDTWRLLYWVHHSEEVQLL